MHCGEVCPVHGRTGSHRADQGRRVAFLDPGPAQHGACLAGQGLGPVPLAACHRHQRPLAYPDRDVLGRADLLPDTDRILQGRVAAIEVTAQDARDPLQQRGFGCQEAARREPCYGFVGVSAHLVGPPPAQHGPQHRGPRLGGTVIGPGRIPSRSITARPSRSGG